MPRLWCALLNAIIIDHQLSEHAAFSGHGQRIRQCPHHGRQIGHTVQPVASNKITTEILELAASANNPAHPRKRATPDTHRVPGPLPCRRHSDQDNRLAPLNR